jgi:MarR family transcriptional regulator, lower aerobic nicotinate degradation pathway regulator
VGTTLVRYIHSVPPVTTPKPGTETSRLPEELLAKSGFLMVRLGMEFRSRAVEALVEAGFSQYHYSALALLHEHDRETQAEMADTLDLDPSQLVGVLDALEERGLIARRRDPRDRRRHLVSLTADGRRQLRRLRTTINRLEDQLFAPLDPDERATLHAMLLRLAEYHDPRCGGDEAPPS